MPSRAAALRYDWFAAGVTLLSSASPPEYRLPSGGWTLPTWFQSVTGSHLTRLSGWLVFPATIFLHDARLPHDISSVHAWALVPSLALVLSPLVRSPRGGALWFIAQHAAGMAWVSTWICRYLVLYCGWSAPVAWSALICTSLCVAAGRYGVLRVLSPLWAQGTVLARVVATASIAAVDLFVARSVHWYEAVSIASSCAEFPGISWLLSAVGVDLATFIVASWVVFILATPLIPRLLFGTVAIGLTLGWQPTLTPMEVIHVVGVQTPNADDWGELSDEIDEHQHLTVLPEGACRSSCAAPFEGYRVAGVREPVVGGRRVYNTVVVERSGSEVGSMLARREKRTLAPLGERRSVIAGVEGTKRVLVGQISLSLPICYEVFDRSLVRDMGGAVGISVSRDSFDGSGRASMYMSKAAWLRALEFRVPFVRVSDTFASVAYDGSGGVVRALPRGVGILDVWLSVPKGGAARPWMLPPLAAWLLLGLAAGLSLSRHRAGQPRRHQSGAVQF